MRALNNGYWHKPALKEPSTPEEPETLCGLLEADLSFAQEWTEGEVLSGEAGYLPCPVCFGKACKE